jgi:hypothetical protein
LYFSTPRLAIGDIDFGDEANAVMNVYYNCSSVVLKIVFFLTRGDISPVVGSLYAMLVSFFSHSTSSQHHGL